ncbi:EAL domain-containing protein [Curvibacter sp. APW13]|uniref:sensor domain-containing protein n=1 Tax=Curvibacter sp. APW13 TaxID=3077236 RepID=UPI0028DE0652|nr:EAL domain-containing protein [Curvibacter sp. APW13]MDT8991781.1 EAL domain-containing protein [Curvibacter sp. APW13]
MKDMLQSWLSALTDAAWLVDPHTLRVVVANQAASQLLGIGPEELIDRPAIELMASPEDMYYWEDVAAGHAEGIHSQTLVRSIQGVGIAVERKVSRVWLDAGTPFFLVVLRDMRSQLAREALLEERLDDLRATLESSHDALLVLDLHGGVKHFNHRFAQMWQLPDAMLDDAKLAALGTHLESWMSDPDAYRARWQVIAQLPEQAASDHLYLRDGRIVERRVVPKFSRGRVMGRVCSYRDVTAQVDAERRLQLAAKVFDCSPDAIFITDAGHRLVQVNPECERLVGSPLSELIGREATSLFSDPLRPDYFVGVARALDEEGIWSGELVHERQGRRFHVQVSWVALRDEHGHLVHTVGFVQDLTARVEAEKRIDVLASTDLLTGLPNRLMLAQRAELMLGLSQRQGMPCGVLFVDLDRFKSINESFGHALGDRVLVEVAQRIRLCLREVDTLSRLGADEFVVFLQEADAFGAEIAARRIIAALGQPFEVQDMDFSLGCSIGIALYPDDGRTVDELIQCADTAMQGVKERGRGSLRFYQPQMNVDWLSRIRMEHAMRQGLERQLFRLVYQPQISLETGQLVGAEALLRWHDPELGQVPPSTFIPLAEESGFIINLGNWVLGEAVRQATLWQKQGMPVVVSVNVSALQFHQAEFVERVADSIRGVGLDPALLELELTESILVKDAEEALAKLDALAALGLSLAIDDFGTGYSSLAYLKKFPISKLKIDRAFVMGLPEDESDKAIVSATVAMARALKLAVVAEGVETDAQRSYLHSVQCASFQGYLCSPGLDADKFTELVSRLPGNG